ncbi:MAG: hypothetical protein AAB965_03770 [Patescibacteria group bacterium]
MNSFIGTLLATLLVASLFAPSLSLFVSVCLAVFIAIGISTGWLGFVVRPLQDVPKKNSIAKPEPLVFKGKILERPEEPHKVANLQFRLTYYLDRIKELDREFQLLTDQIDNKAMDSSLEILDLRYRAHILRWILSGRVVHTGQVYVQAGVENHTLHEIFSNSCKMVEIDLAISGIPQEE